MKDARIGDLAFNQADRSLWGVRHSLGISTLVRIPYPYAEWNQVYSWPYGQDLYDIDISPDGKYLTGALPEISGRQTLIKMEVEKLLAGDYSYDTLFDFDVSNPESFVFSSDGRYLYGSSYYSGVANIYRYDFEASRMEVISNCETGFFRPMPISNDSLIVFRYTAQGFTPVMIPNQPVRNVSAITLLGQEVVTTHPIVKDWIAGSPGDVDIDTLTTYSGRYSGLQHVGLASAYPVVQGYKDFAAVGVRLNFSDPIGLHNIDVTASYTPGTSLPPDERLHASFTFRHLSWTVDGTYNKADFYDLFGPTKTSRKGYSLGVQYHKSLLFDRPRTLEYTIGVTGYGGLERLPDYQNVTAPFSEFLSASASLQYENLRNSLGAVDKEKGVSWSISSSANYVNKKVFPRVFADYHVGLPLPIHHSSLWFRTSAGQSFGDRDEPFANFFFGGFGNNWVDYQEEKRYHEYYSFPGVELNAIGGTNYGKALVEWILPPIRFRRVGGASLFLKWARISLFSSGIVTNVDRESQRRTLVNGGGQIDFRIMLFSYLRTTFSLGYAVAAEEGESLQKEFMISLKIL